MLLVLSFMVSLPELSSTRALSTHSLCVSLPKQRLYQGAYIHYLVSK